MASYHPARVYEYTPGLTAFEFGENTDAELAPNVIIFIGGLGDGVLTVPYITNLSKSLKDVDNGSGRWLLIQILISSSYQGWGTGSLKRDAQEIGRAVQFFRSEKGGNRKKVVLMGHLTGTQDSVQYLSKFVYENEGDQTIRLDGAILQAPVSDRQAFEQEEDPSVFAQLLSKCKTEFIDKGKENDILPQEYRNLTFGVPVTAYRFYSLASVRGDDDFFSSDLTADDHKQTFGKIKTPFLVLYGEKDEYASPTLDRQKLIDSWRAATTEGYWSPLSKVLKGATHNVGPASDEGAEEDLIKTVKAFITHI